MAGAAGIGVAMARRPPKGRLVAVDGVKADTVKGTARTVSTECRPRAAVSHEGASGIFDDIAAGNPARADLRLARCCCCMPPTSRFGSDGRLGRPWKKANRLWSPPTSTRPSPWGGPPACPSRGSSIRLPSRPSPVNAGSSPCGPTRSARGVPGASSTSRAGRWLEARLQTSLPAGRPAPHAAPSLAQASLRRRPDSNWPIAAWVSTTRATSRRNSRLRAVMAMLPTIASRSSITRIFPVRLNPWRLFGQQLNLQSLLAALRH